MVCAASAPLRAARLPSRKRGGFTLIELMIALVVLAILTTIAYPQYTEFVMRSRIVEATTGMNDLRTRMEQFFQDNRRYDNAGACGVAPPAAAYFTVTCTPVGAPALTYNLITQGTGSMASFRYTMSVGPAGITRATTSAPTGWTASGTCWTVRKNGNCA